MSFLEKSWEEREEKVYRDIFGDIGKGIYPLTAEFFSSKFNVTDIDPRWLHYGVFISPPSETRDTWVYISSGMSNPWESDQKEQYSGLGVEFILESKSESKMALTAVLSLVAFNILLSVGRFGESPVLDYRHRIPMTMEPNISHVVIAEPNSFQASFELMSGKVDILQIVGVTPKEYSFAKEHGSNEVLAVLVKNGVGYTVNPMRECTVHA